MSQEPYGYEPGPNGPVGPGGPGGAGRPADLLKRFGARLIDYLILLIPTIIIAVVVGVGAGFNSGFGFSGLLVSIVIAALQVGYFVYLESSRGQTIGKMALSLRTQTQEGGLPSTEQAFKRNAWMLLSIIPVLGAFLQLAAVIAIAVTINSDPANRGWHDGFGDTVVVET